METETSYTNDQGAVEIIEEESSDGGK